MVSGIYEDCGIRLKKIRETGWDVLRLIIPDKHNRFPEDENYMEPYRLQIAFPPSTMWNQHIKHVDYGMKSTPSFVRMYFFGDGIFSSSICAIIRCPIVSSTPPRILHAEARCQICLAVKINSQNPLPHLPQAVRQIKRSCCLRRTPFLRTNHINLSHISKPHFPLCHHA